MDPSYYSPQPTSSRVHAVCYCRVHGNSAQMSRNLVDPRSYHNSQPQYYPHYDPPSPVTRQLMQKHPEAVVIHTTGPPGQSPQLIPCQIVYHHPPVYGEYILVMYVDSEYLDIFPVAG